MDQTLDISSNLSHDLRYARIYQTPLPADSARQPTAFVTGRPCLPCRRTETECKTPCGKMRPNRRNQTSHGRNRQVHTEEFLMSELLDVRVARSRPAGTDPSPCRRNGGVGSPVFARNLWSRAGSPLLVALGFLLLVGCADISLPEHAYTTGGSHWKCERGFELVEGSCQALVLPEHAFLTRSGGDWTCDRGFQRVQEACQSVGLPEHAFLSRKGDSWRCDRGFERIEDKCQSAEEPSPNLPEHAYIDFGRDWKCERGFERRAEACQPVVVPEHAFLNYNADDWTCERGYGRVDSECRAVEIPEHAYLDFGGHEWVCERGLKRDGGGCSIE